MTKFYPNRMGLIILQAMEEVINRSGVTAVLNTAGLSELIDQYPSNDLKLEFSFDTVSHIQAALDQLYGIPGGRGVALRIGRACFKYGIREFGSLLGLTEMAFRLLPLTTKLRVGGNAFARLFNRYTDQRVRFDEDESVFRWQIDVCPLCWNRQSEQPACQLAVGLLQEALYWVSGGKIFNVEETHCIACGDEACTIIISKNPIS
ncbi:MAG: 4-vinyl reductase [Anaerolineales bacterium]|nr:4-vinyl reductase [Anaerolineales bacterium]